MAFPGRFGSRVRQGLHQYCAANVTHTPMASMMNVVRSVTSNLFVGGMSKGTDEQTLKDAFSTYGEVVEAKIIMDKHTGRSKGFGFVKYADDESATAALVMDGKELQGKNIRVNYDDRPPTPRGKAADGNGEVY